MTKHNEYIYNLLVKVVFKKSERFNKHFNIHQLKSNCNQDWIHLKRQRQRVQFKTKIWCNNICNLRNLFAKCSDP